MPAREHKEGKKQWESQQDLWNTTDVRRVRWNQRNESKILMNSTSSFPKKNKESRQHAVWIAVSPFCQSGMTVAGMTSGCPLHNLVPEWNDLLYTGNYQQAYNRLHKTNNFPEFTSVYVGSV